MGHHHEHLSGEGMPDAQGAGTRLDKWLWAARFFKTRGLAAQAVRGGKVHVAGARAKPSRLVKVGDELEITRGDLRFEVRVDALDERRGPAPDARALYTESEQSRTRRERQLATRRSQPLMPGHDAGRPGKHERRARRRLQRGW